MALSGVADYLSSLDDTVKGALASVPGGESLAKAFGFGPPPVCSLAGSLFPSTCSSADGAIGVCRSTHRMRRPRRSASWKSSATPCTACA
jgi:hypothetical protein